MLKRRWFRVLLAIVILTAFGAGLLAWNMQSEVRQVGLNVDLSVAVHDDDLPQIRRLVAEGADPNTPVLYSPPPESFMERIKRTVLRRKADPLGRGETALFRAVAHGDLEMVRSLLAHGADPNATALFGYTALHLVAGMGDKYRNRKSDPLDRRTIYALCIALLEAGANPNAGNTLDGTPYNHAFCLGDGEIDRLFLKHGADWHAQSIFAMTAFLDAVRHNQVERVRMMLAAGASPNQTDDRRGVSVLMIAVANKNTEITRLLLDAGAQTKQQKPGAK